MAISDLLERLSAGKESDDSSDVPDDASELLDDEADDLLPPDPPPARTTRAKRTAAPAPRVTARDRKAVKDGWITLLTVPGGLLSLRDPLCGGAVLDQVDQLAEALTKVTARNPAMLAWFVGDAAPFMDWLAVAMALRPVATTVWAHHVSHSIGGEEEQGAPDFSGYTAPVFSG